MSDEEYNDIFDMSDFEDEPPFDEPPGFDDPTFGELPFEDSGVELSDDDLLEEEFATDTDEDEGISRTFILIAAAIALGVIAIVVLIVLVTLGGGDELTDNQKTATSIAEYNATQIEGNNRTLTALAVIDAATETAVFNAQQSATAAFVERQTQQAIDAQQTATAAAIQAATQTVAAQQTATQSVLDMTATQQFLEDDAARRQVIITLRLDDDTPLNDVNLRLYRDDGDDEFNPEDRLLTTPVPSGDDSGGGTGGAVSGSTLAYGEVGEGTLALGETAEWSFTGSAGDKVSISAEADEPTQMDTFLELFGPQGNRLAGDDDGGEGSNALIESFELPADGTYTAEISSIAGQGTYKLRLNVAIEVPESDTTSYRPNTGGEDLGMGYVLARQGGETPTPEPAGDTLITIQQALEGEVNFGSLDVGTYWVEIEYDSLPAEVQALLPRDQPLVLKVVVPEEGEVGIVDFVIQRPLPTPSGPVTNTPIPSPTLETTAVPVGTQDIVTATASPEPGDLSATPEALPTTGFFSDIAGDGGGLDGTDGLTVLAIAAAGLVAVVVIARKLRTTA